MPLDPNKFTRKTGEALGAAQASTAASATTPRSRPSTCSRRSSVSPRASSCPCSSASAWRRRSCATGSTTALGRLPQVYGQTAQQPQLAPETYRVLETADAPARRPRRRLPLDRAPAPRDDARSPAASATCSAASASRHDAVLDALKDGAREPPGHEREPRGAVPGARALRPRPHRGGRARASSTR